MQIFTQAVFSIHCDFSDVGSFCKLHIAWKSNGHHFLACNDVLLHLQPPRPSNEIKTPLKTDAPLKVSVVVKITSLFGCAGEGHRSGPYIRTMIRNAGPSVSAEVVIGPQPLPGVEQPTVTARPGLAARGPGLAATIQLRCHVTTSNAYLSPGYSHRQ
jgi:hypothetical protein